jgi:hypothetical protein
MSQTDDLKTAVDNFLEDRGMKEPEQEDTKKADEMGPGIGCLLIGIPTHSGEIKAKCAMSLLNLCRKLQDIGVRYEVEIIPSCPIIGVVRNYFANKVAFDLDKDGLFGFSHLLMIDSDSANFENGAMRLISENKSISGLVYATKNVVWEKVESAVRQGVHTNHLAEFGTIPDVNSYGPFDVNRLSRVRHIGGGTLLVRK